MEARQVETFYKDMIEVSTNRIHQINRHQLKATNQGNQSFDFNTQNLNAQRIEELKEQLNQCSDPDLLQALSDEFKRQLETHLLRQAPKQEPPPPQSEHHFFRKESFINGKSIVKFWHFDNQRIARELELYSDGKPPLLLINGRDDGKMCQWNLEEAKIVDDFKDKISEAEFNSVWFGNGGFPYVRPTRKVRRLLTTALFKKI